MFRQASPLLKTCFLLRFVWLCLFSRCAVHRSPVLSENAGNGEGMHRPAPGRGAAAPDTPPPPPPNTKPAGNLGLRRPRHHHRHHPVRGSTARLRETLPLPLPPLPPLPPPHPGGTVGKSLPTPRSPQTARLPRPGTGQRPEQEEEEEGRSRWVHGAQEIPAGAAAGEAAAAQEGAAAAGWGTLS